MASIGLLRAYKWRTGRSSLPSNRGALTEPADVSVTPLPGEKTDLVINLTTAKALGLTIPESSLLHADEVIEPTTYLAAVHGSAYGTKPTCRDESRMSAFGGKAGQAPWCGFDRLGRGRPNSAIRCSEFLQRKLIVASGFADREQATREPKGYTPAKTIVHGLVVLMT